MDNGNEFRVGACNGVDGGKLADAESGDDGGNAVNTCVPVGGVSRVQFIAIADPVEASWLDVV